MAHSAHRVPRGSIVNAHELGHQISARCQDGSTPKTSCPAIPEALPKFAATYGGACEERIGQSAVPGLSYSEVGGEAACPITLLLHDYRRQVQSILLMLLRRVRGYLEAVPRGGRPL